MALEAPHRLSHATETWLHFVGDEETAGSVHVTHCIGEKPGRMREHTIAGENRVDEESCKAHAVRLHALDALANALTEHCGTVNAAWRLHGVYAGPKRSALFGGHPGDDVGHTVVSEISDDESGAARKLLAHPHRQVIGLAAGAGEYDATELPRHGGEQLLGELQRLLGKVAGVGIERPRLAHQRFDHVAVAMTHDRDVVVGIQVGAAVLVIHPHSLRAYDLQRLLVEEPVRGGEQARTACQNRREVLLCCRHKLNSSSNNSSAICSRAPMKSGFSAA